MKITSLAIANLQVKNNVFLAPMAGITDLPMRRLVKSYGEGNVVSEMVAINGISYKNSKSYRIADVREEPYPVVVQMVGGDAELFAQHAEFISSLGAYSLDINMGCPVKKIVNNHSGSYLMTDIERAANIICSVKKSVSLPISVKFRLGWDHQHVNVIEFAKMCEECGADYITVHGRTRSDFYSGKANWEKIAEVKQSVKIPVIGNGDIDSVQSAQNMIDQTNVDGIMVGRAALGAPWLISQIHEYIENKIFPQKISVCDIKRALLIHLKELNEYYGEKLALPLSRKYACWYSKSFRDAKKFRERYVRINNWTDALKEINIFFDYIEQESEEEK